MKHAVVRYLGLYIVIALIGICVSISEMSLLGISIFGVIIFAHMSGYSEGLMDENLE